MTQELIPINNNGGRKTVSARQMYDFLGYDKTHWKRWYTKNIINNKFAVEHEDWEGFATKANGNDSQDFEITIQFAKKIGMAAHTEQGDQIKNYFLACEEKAQQAPTTVHQLPATYLDALKALVESEEQKSILQLKSAEDAPKVESYEHLMDAKGNFSLEQTAKILNFCGRNTLIDFLKEKGVFTKDGSLPQQRFVTEGAFVVKAVTFKRGGKRVPYDQVFVTPKGLERLRKYFNANFKKQA